MALPLGVLECLEALYDIIDKKASPEFILNNLMIQLDGYEKEVVSFSEEVKSIHEVLKNANFTISKTLDDDPETLIEKLRKMGYVVSGRKAGVMNW